MSDVNGSNTPPTNEPIWLGIGSPRPQSRVKQNSLFGHVVDAFDSKSIKIGEESPFDRRKRVAEEATAAAAAAAEMRDKLKQEEEEEEQRGGGEGVLSGGETGVVPVENSEKTADERMEVVDVNSVSIP